MKIYETVRINLDNKLEFDHNDETVFQKQSGTLNTLSRVYFFKRLIKNHRIIKAFFKTQFNYDPLIWMFHYCSLNPKMSNLHGECLIIYYDDNCSTFIFQTLKNGQIEMTLSHFSGNQSQQQPLPVYWDVCIRQ